MGHRHTGSSTRTQASAANCFDQSRAAGVCGTTAMMKRVRTRETRTHLWVGREDVRRHCQQRPCVVAAALPHAHRRQPQQAVRRQRVRRAERRLRQLQGRL